MCGDFGLSFCFTGWIDRELRGAEFPVLQGLVPQFEKYRHIEKVHKTEDKDNGSYFDTEDLDELPGIGDIFRNGKGTNCVADIDQVESNQQKIVNGIRQCGIAMENIHEKNFAVAEKSAGYPDGQN
jgi:hypothetical protein